MFFNSIKELNRLRKEISRLLSKGMSNVYLKVTIETFSQLGLQSSKILSPDQFLGAPTLADIIEF